VNGQEILVSNYRKNFALIERDTIAQYGEEIITQEIAGRPVLELLSLEVINDMVLNALVTEYIKGLGQEVTQERVNEEYQKYYDAELKDNEENRLLFEELGMDETFIKMQLEAQAYRRLFIEHLREDVTAKLALEGETFENLKARVKASHILVATLEEAQQVIARLDAGEAFEDIAKELSLDTASGSIGGDLGFFGRRTMVKDFELVAFSMTQGQISQPVATQFGYHIIRIDAIQTVADLKLDNATEGEIESVRLSEIDVAIDDAYYKTIEELFKNAVIVRNDDLIESINKP
jgi:foldase protein PrsA